MNKKTDLAGYKATVSRVRTLLLRERVIAGTLNRQAVGNAPRFTLTDKVGGKTRCLYVPVSMEAEVRGYVGNWRELKSLLLEMSDWTRKELKERIAAARAGRGGRKGARAASPGKTRKAAPPRKGSSRGSSSTAAT
jgi:hypothetical protein